MTQYRFQFSQREYVEAGLCVHAHFMRWLTALALGGALGLFAILWFQLGDLKQAAGIAGFIVAALVLYLLAIRYQLLPQRLANEYAESPLAAQEYTLALSDEGLSLSGEIGDLRLKWAHLHGYFETKNLIILYYAPSGTAAIPKRLEAEGLDVQALKQRLEAEGKPRL